MKKLFSLILVLVLSFGLVLTGCSGEVKETTTASSTEKTTEGTTAAPVAKFRILPDGVSPEEYGIGFRKGDQTLRDKIQSTMAAMKADGKLSEISTTWFGKDVTTTATTPTTLKPDATDDSWTKVQAAGKLIIGIDDTFKPMGFRDANDNIIGFDIDFAKEVCTRLGIQAEFKKINWNTKETDLKNGLCDCIWNGYSIDEDRAKLVNFSEAYMKNDMVFIVAANSPITGIDGLDNKKIAVQAGSTTAIKILDESKFADNVVKTELATNVLCMNQLNLGLVDAVILDKVVAEYELSH